MLLANRQRAGREAEAAEEEKGEKGGGEGRWQAPEICLLQDKHHELASTLTLPPWTHVLPALLPRPLLQKMKGGTVTSPDP